MRRIATRVVVVQAFNVDVLKYVVGRGRVVSRTGGKGSPMIHVLMVPTVIMTRKFASGTELTKLLAMVIKIGVVFEHNDAMRCPVFVVPTVIMTWKLMWRTLLWVLAKVTMGLESRSLKT